MRFELTTPTLARLCSTPELRPPLLDPNAHDNEANSGAFLLPKHLGFASNEPARGRCQRLGSLAWQ